jgi:hypothetical protein
METKMQLPNLAGIATADLVEKIGGGNFSASYINWSRTMHLLRTNAPGWLPELVEARDGGILHAAPVGCYLLIRFRNGDIATPPVPQAVMDTRNAAIPRDKITARDLTDTHRRGVCMAAAMTFGLAYELWAKMPLESGYEHEPEPERPTEKAHLGLTPARAKIVRAVAAAAIQKHNEGNEWGAFEEVSGITDSDEKMALWEVLKPHSDLRACIKRLAAEAARNQPTEETTE